MAIPLPTAVERVAAALISGNTDIVSDVDQATVEALQAIQVTDIKAEATLDLDAIVAVRASEYEAGAAETGLAIGRSVLDTGSNDGTTGLIGAIPEPGAPAGDPDTGGATPGADAPGDEGGDVEGETSADPAVAPAPESTSNTGGSGSTGGSSKKDNSGTAADSDSKTKPAATDERVSSSGTDSTSATLSTERPASDAASSPSPDATSSDSAGDTGTSKAGKKRRGTPDRSNGKSQRDPEDGDGAGGGPPPKSAPPGNTKPDEHPGKGSGSNPRTEANDAEPETERQTVGNVSGASKGVESGSKEVPPGQQKKSSEGAPANAPTTDPEDVGSAGNSSSSTESSGNGFYNASGNTAPGKDRGRKSKASD